MTHHDILIEKLRDDTVDIDDLDHGDICELAFCLAAERDEARSIAKQIRDVLNDVTGALRGLPWEAR